MSDHIFESCFHYYPLLLRLRGRNRVGSIHHLGRVGDRDSCLMQRLRGLIRRVNFFLRRDKRLFGRSCSILQISGLGLSLLVSNRYHILLLELSIIIFPTADFENEDQELLLNLSKTLILIDFGSDLQSSKYIFRSNNTMNLRLLLLLNLVIESKHLFVHYIFHTL